MRDSATRTEAIELLEDGRIEELAALLDGATANRTTAEVLAQFAARHNRQRDAQSIADIRYRIRWEKAADLPAAPAGEDSAWLVIADGSDVPAPLLAALGAAGHRHRLLGLPVSDADEERLVAELRSAARDEPTLRILHIAAPENGGGPSMRSLLRMQHRILGGTQRLFRAAAAAELRTPIWAVTLGAQRVADSDQVRPEQTALWGFCRVAALEYPQVWGGLADLSEGAADEWLELIRRAASASSGEDQIALRGGTVHVPRLVRRTGLPNPQPLELRYEATYLVTGGLGSVGLEIA